MTAEQARQNAAHSRERRQAPRCPLEIWVEEFSDRELYLQRSANISTGGIFLERTVPHTAGTRVTLRFTLPGDRDRIEVAGMVVNVDRDATTLGMGLAFVDLDLEAHQRIAKYVGSRNGEKNDDLSSTE